MTCIDCNTENIYKCLDDLFICKDCYIDAYTLHIDFELED